MPVGIVGGRGSGKSVFVSLLASTAISHSIESKDKFRYYTDPVFTDAIGKIVSSLKMKAWPPANLKGTLSKYQFHFGYSRKVGEILNPIAKSIPGNKMRLSPETLFNIVRFNLYDVAGEDVEMIRHVASEVRERDGVLLDELPKDLRTILDCNVLVFLVDSSKIVSDSSDPKYQEMLDYDNLMAELISLVAKYKSRNAKSNKEKKIYPVFVLTKFDTVDSKVTKSLGLDQNYSDWLHNRSRKKDANKFAIRLMKKFFSHTLALIYGGLLMDVELDKGQFFFSYIGSELNEEGIPVPKLLPSRGDMSNELDYSYNEYRAFVEYFGEISKEIGGKSTTPGKYVVGLGR